MSSSESEDMVISYDIGGMIRSIEPMPNVIPEKSKYTYELCYSNFTEWLKKNNYTTIDEKIMLEYFFNKSTVYKPSSMWTVYSKLRTTINLNNNVDISTFKKLLTFLKSKSDGYVPKKSKVFTKNDIDKFLLEANDEEFLMMKVALIVGVAGGYSRDELTKLSTKDVTDLGDMVTGGGNGIGKEIAIRFASEGCNIAIADLDFQAAQQTAKELNQANVKIIAKVDISDTDQINVIKANIEEDMPPVDILVNNAGIVPMLSLREGTDKEVERIIQINITAQLHVTRTFLPGMIDRKRGHIVGIASMSALHPMGGAVVYSATKSSMHTFIIALSEEMRQEGNECIKCTSILPYLVSTRKDLVEAANFRFPLITPEYTAKITVDATLRNELMVTIPRSLSSSYYWSSLLPFSIQYLIRDYVSREKGIRLFTGKKNTSVP